MNVLYVLPRKDYFLFGNGGRVSHATGFISGLLQNNSAVTVISGNGLFDIFDHYQDEKKIRYLPLWEINGRFFVNMVGMMRTVNFIRKNFKNFNVVTIRYSAKLGWLFALLLYILRIPNWGFEINSLAAHNFSNPVIVGVSKWIENFFIRLAPVCNVVSPKIKDDIGGGSNVLVLPNGGPKKYLEPFVTVDDKDASIRLYYFGKVKIYYDFDSILDLLKRRTDVSLYIVGESNSLLEDLDNIHYMGEYKDIISILDEITFSKNSFTILPFRRGLSSEIGSPTKMYEMISMGLPILYHPNVGLLKDTLGDKYLGFCFSSEKNLEFLIDDIITGVNTGKLQQISEQEYYDEFTWASRCKQYIEFMTQYKF